MYTLPTDVPSFPVHPPRRHDAYDFHIRKLPDPHDHTNEVHELYVLPSKVHTHLLPFLLHLHCLGSPGVPPILCRGLPVEVERQF